MIYTVGLRQNYDRFLEQDPDLRKGIGGSVWKTREDVERYLHETPYGDLYGVYGVEADWDKDTRESRVLGASWRDILIEARIVKVPAVSLTDMVQIMAGEKPVTQEFHDMAEKFGKAIDEYAKTPMKFDGPSFPMDLVVSSDSRYFKHES